MNSLGQDKTNIMFALWQMHSKAADFHGNGQSILKACHQAAASGATCLVAPAFSISGYIANHQKMRLDFLNKQQQVFDFLQDNLPKDFILVLGSFSTAGQEVVALGTKIENGIFAHRGVTIKVLIFNEISNRKSEIFAQKEDVDLLIVLDQAFYVSGYCPQKNLLMGQWSEHVPVLYVNTVGGQGGYIFCGQSQLIPAGDPFVHQADFSEKLILTKPFAAGEKTSGDSATQKEEYWYQALLAGIRYFVRDAGFSAVHLGLSGGIDSALVATLAAGALGPENVTGVLMPSRYSSEGSICDALALAQNLGISTLTIDIEEMHCAAHRVLGEYFRMEGLVDENLQARIRGLFLMTYSNSCGSLLLNTGNKSELAVGYSTLYGDSCGMLTVIGDLWKTQVYQLCRYINDKLGKEIIPVTVLTKAPSAELRPNQKDQDSLPDYEVLDTVLDRYLQKEFSKESLVNEGYDVVVVERLIRLFHASAYKRAQAAPVLRLSSTAFGFE